MDMWTTIIHWKGDIEMAKEKEILTRFLGGESQRSIAAALGVSRNTVAKMVDAFRKEGLDADAVEKMSRQDLAERLFPSATSNVGSAKPDFEHIHKELLRPGVNLKLLTFGFDSNSAMMFVSYLMAFMRTSGAWQFHAEDAYRPASNDEMAMMPPPGLAGGVDTARIAEKKDTNRLLDGILFFLLNSQG